MAGGGDQKDNPVAINVVPMVDVIFCLCVFFMCSLKFKQLEGKFDSWLPRDKGVSGPTKVDDLIKEIRIAMFWDEAQAKTTLQMGEKKVGTDQELAQLIGQSRDDFIKLGKLDFPTTVDAEPKVPWHDVIRVVNICKQQKIDRLEFAFGAQGSLK